MKKKKLRKSIRLMSLAFLALGESRVGQAKSFEGSKGKMHNLSKSIINRPLEKKNYMK